MVMPAIDWSFILGAMSNAGAGWNNQPWAKGLNASNQAGIGSYNFMKWMQQIIGKEGGKVNLSNKGLNATVPMAAMQEFMKDQSPTKGNQTGGGAPSAFPEMPTGFNAGPNTVPVPGAVMNPAAPGVAEPEFPTKVPGQYVVNPSSSPLPRAGVGGLTPEAMHNIYQTGLGYQELERRKVADWLTYDATSTSNQLKAAEEARRWYELNREAPFTMPDGTPMSLDDFKAMPDDVKSYYAYVRMQRQTNPNEGLMPFADWKNVDKETRSQYLSWLMGDPKRMAAAKELAKASGTKISIGEKADTKEALDSVSARTYFTSAAFVESIQKYKNDRFALFRGNPEKTAKAVYDRIVEEIVAHGGDIGDTSWSADGKIVIWRVRWSDGKEGEVRYVVY